MKSDNIYIGVSIDIINTDDKDIDPGREKHGIDSRYLQIIKDAGAIPVLLPHLDNKDLISPYLDMVDGLLLSGGDDIDPLLYQQDRSPKCGRINIKRDQSELAYLSEAYNRKMPILGICRGMQLINIFRGGTLFQDIDNNNSSMTHWQNVKASYPIHQLKIEEESELYSMLQQKNITVNSFHHQSIDSIGKGLIISAIAYDNTIEGIEDTEYPFLIGLQWHPEALQNNDTTKIIEAFVDKAKQYK